MSDVTFTTRGALGKSSLREANDRVVLGLIRRQPGISRLEIAKMTGLSPSALTGIATRLERRGLIRERRVPPAEGAAGRPPTELHLRADAHFAIGVEITPSGATAALADLQGQGRERIQVPVKAKLATFLAATHDAIAELAHLGGSKVLGVAVSVPGNFDPATGEVRQATNLAWRNVDAISALRQGLELPFFWENNANLSALAERWFTNRAPDHFVFVTLRVGLGTGLIVNGTLVRGNANCAGEFGHMTLVPGGRACVCGKAGCWEEYASDRALLRHYGAESDSLDVVARARNGDPRAARALEETARGLAQGLAPVILGLNPAAIALDDWGAAGWDLIRDTVWAVLRERVPEPWLRGVEIFPSRQTPLAGAVALVLMQFFTSFAPEHEGSDVPVRMRW